MSSASILGPPRNGRKVRSVEEVLIECSQNNGIEQSNLDGIEVTGGYNSNHPVIDGNTHIGDVFSFDRLRHTDAGFVLHGLETEDGRWEKITLSVNWANLSWDAWIDVSIGAGRVNDTRYERLDVAEKPDWILAPMKVVYWFMRAGKTIESIFADAPRGAQDPGRLEMTWLRDFFKFNGKFPHHADLITKEKDQIIHQYTCLPSNCFNCQSHKLAKTWDQIDYTIEPQAPISPVLGALLGDTSIPRVYSVIRWAAHMPYNLPAILKMPVFKTNTETLSTFYTGSSGPFFDASLDRRNIGPAYLVHVDEHDFTPRGGV